MRARSSLLAALIILVFFLAQSNSLFLHCFSLTVFLFLLFDVGSGGAFFWLCMKVSDQVRAGTAPMQGKGTAEYAGEGGGLPAAYARE